MQIQQMPPNTGGGGMCTKPATPVATKDVPTLMKVMFDLAAAYWTFQRYARVVMRPIRRPQA